VTSATYDPANRLTARTAAGVTASPTWDANGSMTSDGTRAYAWDARNRLTAITGLALFPRRRLCG
jgi:YD repeat-containing protein